jgi:hypothetical protein
MRAVEEGTFQLFEGNTWWVYEIFHYENQDYSYLIREDDYGNPFINYALMFDLRLSPLTLEDKQAIAEVYAKRLVARFGQYGQNARPGVMKHRGNYK